LVSITAKVAAIIDYEYVVINRGSANSTPAVAVNDTFNILGDALTIIDPDDGVTVLGTYQPIKATAQALMVDANFTVCVSRLRPGVYEGTSTTGVPMPIDDAQTVKIVIGDEAFKP
jgi:hypothetical protein